MSPRPASPNRGPSDSRRAAILDALLPLAAVMVALLIGGLVLLALGKDPLRAYTAMFLGAFGSVSGLTQTLTKATPLILV
ncbi:MAG: ABC transporter permease, partial [Chloroflexales bacterium]|nr:ABC transporter permease [Chloroflexales bacterium]